MSTATRSDPIDEHLARLARRLPGGRLRRRHGLLLEARDGLEDAAEAYRRGGLDERAAAERAVADFGEVDELSHHYAAQLVSESVRTAALVLGIGYAVILGTWNLLGRLVPDGQPDGSPMAAASFTWIGVASIALTVVVCVTLRRQARRHETRFRSLRLAWLMGLAGFLLAVATLVASYLVQPWGQRAPQPHSVVLVVSAVESVSALVTFTVIGCSLHCLWSAWTVRRRS